MKKMPNNPKKILYVASTASHLQRFHQPYLQALRQSFSVHTMASGEGVDFNIRFDKSFFSLANFRSIFKIRRVLKRERFDAVILHTTLAAFLARAAMICMRHRPHVLNVVHGYLFPYKIKGKKEKLLLFCEKLMRKKTDELAVMNAEDLQIATENSVCLGSVRLIKGMGLPIPTELPKSDPDLRARFMRRPNDFICTFVGELSARKNQIFLIRMTARLREEGIPVRLLLVGEGSERAFLQREISALHLSDAVFLIGDQASVLPYLGITDLYVSASISEGLPFNIMEAMACKLPIVASDVKGQQDLLSDTPNALYPLDDADAFCDAVRRVYASGRFGAGKQSYSVLEAYSLPAVFEENMKLFTIGWN